MARNKDQLKLALPKPTNKEILIGYITTLTDNQSKEAYQILLERFNPKRARIIKFTREGIQATNGKVRLTPREYERIIEQCGEIYFHRAVEVLYDYIVHLEERSVCESLTRQRLREYNKISHYYKLTKGWVAERITQEMNINSQPTSNPYNESLNFYDIETLEQAKEYIKSIPIELRPDNPEIEYLTVKFPTLLT